MERMTRSFSSPAILVAVAALVAALVGTAIAGPAANTSSTKKTAKKALRKAKEANVAALAAQGSADVAQDSAASAQGSADAAQGDADSARNLANAAQSSANTALSRSAKLSYSTDATTATTTLFDGSGLVIQGHCAGGNLDVEAVSQADNSIIHVAVISDNAPNTDYTENDAFNSEDSVPLKAAHPTDNIQGTFTFRNGQSGKIVTSTYLLEEGNPLTCNAFGTLAIQ